MYANSKRIRAAMAGLLLLATIIGVPLSGIVSAAPAYAPAAQSDCATKDNNESIIKWVKRCHGSQTTPTPSPTPDPMDCSWYAKKYGAGVEAEANGKKYQCNSYDGKWRWAQISSGASLQVTVIRQTEWFGEVYRVVLLKGERLTPGYKLGMEFFDSQGNWTGYHLGNHILTLNFKGGVITAVRVFEYRMTYHDEESLDVSRKSEPMGLP